MYFFSNTNYSRKEYSLFRFQRNKNDHPNEHSYRIKGYPILMLQHVHITIWHEQNIPVFLKETNPQGVLPVLDQHMFFSV